MCSTAHVDSQCQSSWQEKPPEQVLNWIQTRSLLKKKKQTGTFDAHMYGSCKSNCPLIWFTLCI